jgi:hypothetical protein
MNIPMEDGECLLVQVSGEYPMAPEDLSEYQTRCLVVVPAVEAP